MGQISQQNWSLSTACFNSSSTSRKKWLHRGLTLVVYAGLDFALCEPEDVLALFVAQLLASATQQQLRLLLRHNPLVVLWTVKKPFCSDVSFPPWKILPLSGHWSTSLTVNAWVKFWFQVAREWNQGLSQIQESTDVLESNPDPDGLGFNSFEWTSEEISLLFQTPMQSRFAIVA